MEADILHIQTNANETDNKESGELIKRTHVDKTPFMIIEDERIGEKFIAMGQYRLTHGGQTTDELKKIIKNKDWEFLSSVISVITTQIIETYKNK